MKPTFRSTMIACYISNIVQAVVNNFLPLLFVMFETRYAISVGQLTLLISVNFVVQLTVDLLATRFVDRIGYRVSALAAHALGTAGLLLLTVLPEIMDPFAGILVSVVLYAAGGGLIEVVSSPIIESCPTTHKEAAMSLLHSFYCWGHVGVVLLSTVFFYVCGIENWKWLAIVWAMIPAANFFLFLRAPIGTLISADERGMSFGELVGSKLFWILFAMMFLSGASEQALVQWSSAFAEQTLGIPKWIGDLAGPMAFAVCMGSARAFYGKHGDRIDLDRFMQRSGILCVFSYLLTVLSPLPVFSLLGCALCGLSVGILWPGTYSKAAKVLRRGGTAMFAMLAVAGDLGCSAGPSVVGVVSDLCKNNLKAGILAAVLFPLCLLGSLRLEKACRKPGA